MNWEFQRFTFLFQRLHFFFVIVQYRLEHCVVKVSQLYLVISHINNNKIGNVSNSRLKWETSMPTKRFYRINSDTSAVLVNHSFVIVSFFLECPKHFIHSLTCFYQESYLKHCDHTLWSQARGWERVAWVIVDLTGNAITAHLIHAHLVAFT